MQLLEKDVIAEAIFQAISYVQLQLYVNFA